VRLTRKEVASSRSGMRRSPGLMRPRAMSSRNCSKTWSDIRRGLMGFREIGLVLSVALLVRIIVVHSHGCPIGVPR
jgi:hypothetical protein